MGLWFRKRGTPAGGKSDESLPIIRLQGVSKTFRGESDDDTIALDEVSVDINRGEYVSVSGPSGCGKSTFLSILALLETPTKGQYWLNGRRTDQLTHAERARVRSLDVGLIFQSFNLIADMSVYENVEYPLTLRGKSAQERAERVNAALERVGMTSRAKQRPGQLSGRHARGLIRRAACDPRSTRRARSTGTRRSRRWSCRQSG